MYLSQTLVSYVPESYNIFTDHSYPILTPYASVIVGDSGLASIDSTCSKCSSVMGLTKLAPDTGLRVTPMIPLRNSLAVGWVATCTMSPQ